MRSGTHFGCTRRRQKVVPERSKNGRELTRVGGNSFDAQFNAAGSIDPHFPFRACHVEQLTPSGYPSCQLRRQGPLQLIRRGHPNYTGRIKPLTEEREFTA